MTEIPVLDEDVPISVDQLIELRTIFANVGIDVMRFLQVKESEVNMAVLAICMSHGIDPQDYAGLDLEKGVIRRHNHGTRAAGTPVTTLVKN